MNILTLQNYFQSNITLVENEFIDHYMAKANGEYVKVYLLLLRHINNPGSSLSISKIADCLENTEGDIIRALKYWEKTGLLTLKYDSDQTITGIDLGRKEDTTETMATPKNISVAPAVSLPATESSSEGKSSRNRKELKQILFIAEQ